VSEDRFKEIFEREWAAEPRVEGLETLPWIKHFSAGPDDEDMLVKFVVLKHGANSSVSMLHFSSRDYEMSERWVAQRARDQIERIAMIKRSLEENLNGHG
jgi:hypothetical protein